MSLTSRARVLKRTGLITHQQAIDWLRRNGVEISRVRAEQNLTLKEADALVWERYLESLRSKKSE